MKLLGLFVAGFALLAFVAGQTSGDSILYVLGAASLIASWTTFRAAGISSFLKIFAAIFAAETVVFGLGVLAVHVGAWPQAYMDYVPPDSLPLTVAIFAIIVYVVSGLAVVRQMTKIADLYFNSAAQGVARLWPLGHWQGHERRIATAMVVFLVLVNQAQVAISVRLSFFSRDWFNAIQNKNEPEFWNLLLTVFTPWAFVLITSSVIEFVVQSMLVIRWRRWLTDHFIARWLGEHTHYRMSLKHAEADNPDQRIAEDVNRFIDGGTEGYGIYSYSILLISTISSLVSFAIVLWGLSGNYTFPGTNTSVPGFLFWVALIYAAVGTIITHVIGRSLVGLYFQKQKVEADFRFSLARLREYGEQIALLSGEKAEQASLGRRFGAVIANYLMLVDRRKKLLAFTSSYGQLSPIIPYIFTAPFYFAGKIQLGVMTQTAGAFGRVEGALTFFITYYTSLAGFKSVLDRLTSFGSAIDHARELATGGPDRAAASGDAVDLDKIDLKLPDGRHIADVDGVSLKKGESLLLAGPSGSGKSTLFRAIAGIWPYGEGTIRIPDGTRIMVVPQKPYIPNGTLRGAVAYPAEPDAYPDSAITEALTQARLAPFATRLDEADAWGLRLSGGEQQRLALARALLAKPDWLFLDEATAALDESLEAEIYTMLAQALPQTTIVSIGHRSTLAAFHNRRIDMQPAEKGGFVLGSEAAAVK